MHSYVAQHNHELRNQEKNVTQSNKITNPIKKTISEFKGKLKNTQELTEYINKTHNTKVTYQQVHYHMTKIHDEEYGKLNEDSNLLIKIAEEEKKALLCKFEYSSNENNELTHFIGNYLSKF